MAGFVTSNHQQRAEMLSAVGLKSPDRLFEVIPDELRRAASAADHELSGPYSELEIVRQLTGLAEQNQPAASHICFLGAGAYDHYQPAAVRHLLQRQEFATAYTPYQPEISQGTLQGIFEFQSLVCRLTGLDIANSSMYDGATAAAEALLMACRATGRSRIIIAGSLHPHTQRVIETYLPIEDIVVLPANEGGDWAATLAASPPDQQTAAVLVQSPDFFGLIQDLPAIAALAHQAGALAVASCDLLSLSLLRTPGEAGVDIAVGEAQSLGLPLSFGGPYAGYLAARDSLLRRMPGRICGETVDRQGRRAFVLTIQAREQHIRRANATSNICTNQALCALAATINAALLGGTGLREVAGQSARKAAYLCRLLFESGWFDAVFTRPFFREFVLRLRPGAWPASVTIADLNQWLAIRGVVGGLDLSHADPAVRVKDGWLLAVTEKRSRHDLDFLLSLIVDFRRERGC